MRLTVRQMIAYLMAVEDADPGCRIDVGIDSKNGAALDLAETMLGGARVERDGLHGKFEQFRREAEDVKLDVWAKAKERAA